MTDASPTGVTVIRLDEPPATVVADDGRSRWTKERLARLIVLFITPTVLAILYFTMVAADVYVSETQFLVRSGTLSLAPRSNGELGEASGPPSYATDARSAIAFITSRDGLRAVSRQIDFRARYSGPHGDPLTRFPPPFAGQLDEDLFAYYIRRVHVSYDESSGLTTLSAMAFDPETAQAICRVLLIATEDFVDGLSSRMRRDALLLARQGFEMARQRLLTAQNDLQDWRLSNQQFDPAIHVESAVALVTGLSVKLAEAQAELNQLRLASPSDLKIGLLVSEINELQEQIRREWSRLSVENAKAGSLISAYEQLLVARDIARSSYQAASAELDIAKERMARKTAYLETVSSPRRPDGPQYPHRLMGIATTAAFAFIAFVIVDQISQNLRRHRLLAKHLQTKAARNG